MATWSWAEVVSPGQGPCGLAARGNYGLSQRSGAQGARKQGAPVAGSGLGEDRFEVVLDGVFGDEHVPGDVPGGGSGGEMMQEFGLARGKPGCPGEHPYPVTGDLVTV